MNRSEIEQRASDILRDHNLLSVPVDPLNVARALGIKVMNAVFSEEGKSGAIVKRGGEISIYINTNDLPARKRFTIAHEIGHKLLHMASSGDSEFVDTKDNFRVSNIGDEPNWSPDRKKEWEANAFASALLMNTELVKLEWQNFKDPSVLAWTFQVSISAMSVRLAQLGLFEEPG